jgi:hypothetical protein
MLHGHTETEQPRKNGVRREDNIKKPGQGPPKLITNLTAPTLEVHRQISKVSTMTRSTGVPIPKKKFHMVSQSKQKL